MTWLAPPPSPITEQNTEQFPPPPRSSQTTTACAPPPPPPSSPHRPQDEESEPSAETQAERRSLSAVPAAAWVAQVGCALVLVASAILVASSWDAIGRGFRFAGLVVGTARLIAAAERLRRGVPTTAGIVAHLGTFLGAPVGIAATSLLGFTWPTCLAVGGLLAIVATEVQARRWQRTTFHIGQVAAVGMAATGIAAVTSTTAGLIAAIASAGMLAIGAHRRAAGLALAAVLSPMLSALADAGIGAGVLERAGLVGVSLSWSGPLVGVLAAMVLGIVASQRSNNGPMMTAFAAPAIGAVSGLAEIDGSIIAWLSVPALVVILGELAWWSLPTDRHRRLTTGLMNGLSGSAAAVAIVSPLLVRHIDLPGATLSSPWAIPAIATALAMLLATYRWTVQNSKLADCGIASGLAAVLATTIALEPPASLIAVISAVLVAVGAISSRKLSPIAIYLPALWAANSVLLLDTTAWNSALFGAMTLLAGVIVVIGVARARIASETRTGRIEIGIVV
jgi:hypothetical protein